MGVNRSGSNPSIKSITSPPSTKSTKLPFGTELTKTKTKSLVNELNKSFKELLELIEHDKKDDKFTHDSQIINKLKSDLNEAEFKSKYPKLAEEIKNFNPNLGSKNYEP